MSASSCYANFQLIYELSPIVLVGGIAIGLPGNSLPIISLTQAVSFAGGILSTAAESTPITADRAFARFMPLPGSKLITQDIGTYPFANQATAANAIITKPKNISLMMICPVRDSQNSYQTKQQTITNLIGALEKHNGLGGTYTVATPSYIYTNCVMLDITDATSGGGAQVQYEYQFDFEQTLLTLAAATGALNALTTKMSSGTQMIGQPSLSGIQTSIGQQTSLGTPPIIPAATPQLSSGIVAP